MNNIAKDRLLLTAMGLLIFFGNLGAAPLWDRDEPRNAGCTAEMLENQEFVVPLFNDELRTHKPIMLYWLMMVSYSVLGNNELGARAVSALAGIGTVLLTYGIGRRRFGRNAAFWSAMVLSSTILFSVAARAATPDALLVFCSTLAMYCYVRGSSDEESIRQLPAGLWWYAMYAAMGLGVLVKGPVGLVLPTAVIGMYLLIVGLPQQPPIERWWHRILAMLRPFGPVHFLRTCWRMRPVTALLTAGIVAVPWYAWVHFRTQGVWTTEFFWIHNVSRASATMEGHSGPPILFYVAALLVGFFPWSILTIPVACQLYRAEHEPRIRPSLVFLLCWIGVYVGLFSLAQTKLPSYITPCYPALALLVGYAVSQWQTSSELPVGWIKVGLGHWIALGVGMLVALPIAASRWLPGSAWLGVVGLVPLFGGMVGWHYVAKFRFDLAKNALAATSVGFIVLLMLLVPAEIGRHRQDHDLFAQIRQHRGPIISYGHLEPSWIYYGGKPIREFPAEDVHGLTQFLVAHPDCMLITTDRRLPPLSQQVPRVHDFGVAYSVEYFLRDRQLLVLVQDPNHAQLADLRGDERPRMDVEPRSPKM